MNSVPVGHLFQFRQSFIDWWGSGNWRDAARVHYLKVGYAMADQLLYQLVFKPNKTRHEYWLIVWVVGVGAVATVTATARKQVSGKRRQYDTWFVPFACITGVTACTIFLKISGGVVTTLPAKLYLPVLLKGREVVPSNCSRRTELLPSKSKTKAAEFLAFSATVDAILLTFSGHGVLPAAV